MSSQSLPYAKTELRSESPPWSCCLFFARSYQTYQPATPIRSGCAQRMVTAIISQATHTSPQLHTARYCDCATQSQPLGDFEKRERGKDGPVLSSLSISFVSQFPIFRSSSSPPSYPSLVWNRPISSHLHEPPNPLSAFTNTVVLVMSYIFPISDYSYIINSSIMV